MRQATNAPRAAAPMLESRHQVSGLNSRFIGGQPAFADYVASQRQMIAQARPATDAVLLEKIITGNSPFELTPPPGYAAGRSKPYARGIVLTHGLSDSPYFMRYLAEFLQAQGFRVMAVLLPGHGTRPGDLLDVSWREWARAVAYGAERMAAEADEVYLGGYSAGGALSVHHSLLDERVRGLFLFSPALEITSRAAWANLHKFYSWLTPAAKWVAVMPDRDLYKYESFPKNAAAQMHALTREVARQMQRHALNVPVFTAASLEDATVHAAATVEFMAGVRHPASRLILYAAEAGGLPSAMPAGRVEWVNSVVPGQNILGAAHTSIVLPPEDSYYGAAGEYSSCIHYYPGDMEKYEACIRGAAGVLQGEVTPENLRAGLLRRLMYNPNFAALKASLQHFIEALP